MIKARKLTAILITLSMVIVWLHHFVCPLLAVQLGLKNGHNGQSQNIIDGYWKGT